MAIGGAWTTPPPTCTMPTSYTVIAGDELVINSGVTLEFASNKNLINQGSITNNGIITITGFSDITGNINNTKTATFTNTGTINLNGGSGKRTGELINRDSAAFTNSGTINIAGGGGDNSGALRVIHDSTFSNTNAIIITGGSGVKSGYIGLAIFGEFTNTGSIMITGASGTLSGLLDNWDAGIFTNFGTITITGNSGTDSGVILNMGTGSFTNNGIISLKTGSGFNSGRLINSQNANFVNLQTITITSGGAATAFPLFVKDDSTFTNKGIITTVNNILNFASINNFGTITIGNDLKNEGKIRNVCATITITGKLIGNKISETGCGTSNSHQDPTIGITSWGLQVVENGICINITCWTVTENFHQDFELVELLSDSTNTISVTVYCQRGVDKCNYVAFGVSPYGTNINDSVWKVILEKDHNGKWTMTVIDPDGYLGDVTSTTQIVNDGKNLAASISALFIKPTPGMILNVETRDSGGGYSDNKFNDGIAIKDVYAYPTIETSYEEPLEVESLCLNENPNKRYTCAFEKVREWTIKNAEKALSELG